MSRAEVIRAEAALARLPGWTAAHGGKAVRRTFKFESFRDAFAFMARAALEAERLDHHPDWFNSYKRVQVMLTTHSSGGVTEIDVKLAQAMDRAASGLGAS
ncbi:MAG TPA: 4a-hydroxytetrahydrobiopterin dehydratase [Caulobacteraceae bacterium]|jgi:4a-hydroxytetrahydrobiopterin dehydratase